MTGIEPNGMAGIPGAVRKFIPNFAFEHNLAMVTPAHATSKSIHEGVVLAYGFTWRSNLKPHPIATSASMGLVHIHLKLRYLGK